MIINDLFCKNLKIAKNHPTGIFSHISIWSLAQKRLILIEWITINAIDRFCVESLLKILYLGIFCIHLAAK